MDTSVEPSFLRVKSVLTMEWSSDMLARLLEGQPVRSRVVKEVIRPAGTDDDDEFGEVAEDAPAGADDEDLIDLGQEEDDDEMEEEQDEFDSDDEMTMKWMVEVRRARPRTNDYRIDLLWLGGKPSSLCWRHKGRGHSSTSNMSEEVWVDSPRPGAAILHPQTYSPRHTLDILELQVYLDILVDTNGDKQGGKLVLDADSNEDCVRDIVGSLGHALHDEDMSDFKLVCQGREFRCHKFVLASRSSVFKAMLFGSGRFEEVKTGRLEIEDFKPGDVEHFLKFVYVGECDFTKADPWAMFGLADKYDVQMLAKYSYKALQLNLKKSNCLDYLDKGSLYRTKGLVRSALILAMEDKKILKNDKYWTQMAKKHPELLVEVMKIKSKV